MKRSFVTAVVVAAALAVAHGVSLPNRHRDGIVADWQWGAKPRRVERRQTPRKWAHVGGAGSGQTVIHANGATPCPKRPGPPKWWEGTGAWNPCNGNLTMTFLGGLLVYNSERNSAIHPFHSTGGAPPGGYAGWGFKIAEWDQQLTPDDAGNPPSSVTIADGLDGQDVYALVAGSSNPLVYEDVEDKHWIVTTSDQKTWQLRTFDGAVYRFDTRPHGILLTSITDGAGNETTIRLDPSTDAIDSVVDALQRTWTFGYTNGNLTSITTPVPESLSFTLQYDTQGYDDLTTIQLPSAQGAPRTIQLGYVDWQGNHSPYVMSMQSPAGLTTFDFFQDGALVNVFYLQVAQTLPVFHAEYNANTGSNLVTSESPAENSPKTRIVYDGTFDQGSGDPRQDFWITSVIDADGIGASFTRNGRKEVTQLVDGFKQTWVLTYWPNGEDLKTITDPGGHATLVQWNPPGARDGASSGEVASIADASTGTTRTFVWDQATSGVFFHTIDEIHDAVGGAEKLAIVAKKARLADGRYTVRQYVAGHLVGEQVLDPRGDAVVESDSPGFSERLGLDGYDQPKTSSLLAQGAPLGQPETFDLSPNGVLRSFRDALGETFTVMSRDALLRPLETLFVSPAATSDTKYGYAPDPGDVDGLPVSIAVSANGVQEGRVRQPAAANGVEDCASAAVVNGHVIPLEQTKVVVSGARVSCGGAPPPPPPPPADAGATDAGPESDAGWTVDASPDVGLPEAGCPPPNGIACQTSALEQDGWCAYACQYEPAWLCQDPTDCSNSGLDEWSCPNPPVNPCPGF